MSAAFSVLIQFFVSRFAGRTDRGATAVEYGLLLAGIAIALIAGITLLGPAVTALFTNMAGELEVPA